MTGSSQRRRAAFAGHAAVTGLVALGLTLWGWGFVLAFELRSVGATVGDEDPIVSALWQTSLLGFLGVGSLLATKRPANPIGWVLLVAPLLFWSPVSQIIVLSEERGAELPWVGVQVNWIMHGVGSPALMMVVLFVLLAFPNGEFTALGRRILKVAVPVSVVLIPVRLVAPGPMDGSALSNPHAWNALGDIGAVLQGAGEVVALLVIAALWDLVRRYRRSDGAERQQFRWVVRAIVAAPVTFLTVVPLGEALFPKDVSQYTDLLGIWLAMGSISAAIAVSILRYRLWEIDRVVSRTVSYALVTALLGGVYAAGVLGVGKLVPGGSSDLLVAGSTLAVAALFQPVRRRVQAVVDRRFNRARYDAQREVALLVDRLRREVELDGAVDELANTVDRVVRPSTVSLVLLAGGDR